MISDAEHLSISLLVIFVSSWKNIFSGLLFNFSNELCVFVCLFFILNFMSYLHTLAINPFIRHIICKCLLLFSRVPFHFIDGFL